jgi:hypothetical protein
MHRRTCIHLAMLTAAMALLAGATRPAHAQGVSKTPAFVQAFPNPGAVLVTFGNVLNATGYNIYRRDVGQTADKAVKVNAQPISQSFFIDTGLTNGKPLLYSVKAIFQDGTEGPASADAVVTPQMPILGGFFSYEIGTAHPSSLTLDGNTLTVKASGGELWDNYDSGTFIAAPVSGDYTITVKVLGHPVGSTSDAAKAGVMIRENLIAGERYAYLFVSQSRDPEVLYEGRKGILGGDPGNYSQGGTSLDDTKFPIWLRLVKQEATITAFQSFDGTNFTQVGDPQDYGRTFPQTYAGLGVTALADGEYTTAQFDVSTLQIK